MVDHIWKGTSLVVLFWVSIKVFFFWWNRERIPKKKPEFHKLLFLALLCLFFNKILPSFCSLRKAFCARCQQRFNFFFSSLYWCRSRLLKIKFHFFFLSMLKNSTCVVQFLYILKLKLDWTSDDAKYGFLTFSKKKKLIFVSSLNWFSSAFLMEFRFNQDSSFFIRSLAKSCKNNFYEFMRRDQLLLLFSPLEDFKNLTQIAY